MKLYWYHSDWRNKCEGPFFPVRPILSIDRTFITYVDFFNHFFFFCNFSLPLPRTVPTPQRSDGSSVATHDRRPRVAVCHPDMGLRLRLHVVQPPAARLLLVLLREGKDEGRTRGKEDNRRRVKGLGTDWLSKLVLESVSRSKQPSSGLCDVLPSPAMDGWMYITR